MAETEDKKPVFRIILEKSLNRELEELKGITGVSIAEHMRKASRFYLLFRDETGEVNDVEMMRFYAEWQFKNKKKAKAAK